MNPSDFDIGVLSDIPNKSLTFFWILAISGIVSIVLARLNSSTYINGLFQYSKNYNQKLLSLKNLSSHLLLFNYVISLTLSFYIFLEVLEQRSAENKVFLILIGVICFFVLKTGIQYLVANWFQRKDIFDIKNAFRLYQITGLFLLPISVFSLYQTINIKFYYVSVLLTMLLVSQLIHWYISMKDSIQYKISLFYIFLYLCTLEILPLFLLTKYLLA